MILGAVHLSATTLKLKGKCNMTTINPGPKPKREDGKDDRRHHVNPPTKPKHPTLPVHDPKKK